MKSGGELFCGRRGEALVSLPSHVFSGCGVISWMFRLHRRNQILADPLIGTLIMINFFGDFIASIK